MIDQAKIEQLQEEIKAVEAELADPAVYASPQSAKLVARQRELTGKLELFSKLKTTEDQLNQARDMLSDPEMKDLASAEIPDLEKELEILSEQAKVALLPSDPNDHKDAIIEIRAGAGGDESSLFAGELLRMYLRFCERHNLKASLLSESAGTAGGYKEVIVEITGADAYGMLRYESGVHRVQRIPATESAGRVHTSTATVAVLPEAEENDLEINPNDLRIDVFRSGGHGGQSVNTTDSAVRITHLPTGTVVTCQDEKSQLKNKLKAMGVLRSRLLVAKQEAEAKELGDARKSQIGTGDRSEKIRTYNFPQDRLTDHRIGYTTHGLNKIMDGELDSIFTALREAAVAKALENQQ
jgi:peptide chain release factor 1